LHKRPFTLGAMNSHYRCLEPAALLTIKSEHAQLWTSGGRWGWLPVSAYERETIWYSSRESPTACAGYDLGQSSTRHRNIRLTAYSATLISRARTPIANLRVGKDWRRCPSLTHAGDADAVMPFSGAGSLTQSMRICRRAFSQALQWPSGTCRLRRRAAKFPNATISNS